MERPLAPVFRAWFGVEVLFGVASILTVGLRPDDTATNFAWTITPTVTAALLGGFYVAVAPAFVLATLAKSWERVRVVVVPAILFTLAELVATVLHWDRFAVGSRAFGLWLASYALPPPIFMAMWFWYRRSDPAPSPRNAGVSRPPSAEPARAVLVSLGSAALAIGAAGLAFPGLLQAVWAWTLTPLTSRVIAGWFIGMGALAVAVVREEAPDRILVAVPTLALLFPAALLQLIRFRQEVDWMNPMLIAAGLGASLAGWAAVTIYSAGRRGA